ncbi:DUF3592 domain-containing protein [Rufibacter psychrotolerans]|uniref:DUF3592 domain-containing protein n=1 Tax=Rufibacter psychrotolerans TaxID=2812556 RepID=UPI0019672527|nr:DUF3592 domain-containing protein [Rufibacter sp. SYSU D00308]
MQDTPYTAMKPLFWLGTLFILGCGLYMLFWSRKDLQEFQRVTGPITRIAPQHPDFPHRAGPKDRYLYVAGFPKAFEVYLGGDTGDFLPDFQSIAHLRPGDTVTVYYEEAPSFVKSGGEEEKIIFFTQQIERQGQPHYIRGNFNVYFANFMIITGALLGCFLFFYQGK